MLRWNVVACYVCCWQEGVYGHLHDRERDSNHRAGSHSVRVHLSTRSVELARLLRRRPRVRILTHLTSPNLVRSHLNLPHFVWTECAVIGCSHGELDPALWPWVTPNPQTTRNYTLCVVGLFHIFIVGKHRDFKYNMFYCSVCIHKLESARGLWFKVYCQRWRTSQDHSHVHWKSGNILESETVLDNDVETTGH